MSLKDINLLLVKYFKGNLSESEMSLLEDWAEQNQEKFKELVRINFSINKALKYDSKVDCDSAYFDFLNRIKKIDKVNDLKPKRRLFSLLKYASVFLLVVVSGYFLMIDQNSGSLKTDLDVDNKSEITLTLNDGTVKSINTKSKKEIYNEHGEYVSTQDEDELIYKRENKNSPVNKKEPPYNLLTIPNGQIFKVSLEDGTKVTMNAGSSLRYPEFFSENKPREVFLEGEAYFEVSKDINRPFLVSTDRHKIHVLGTKFNVNSYNGNQMMFTVLVEGSVGIYGANENFNTDESTLLAPGQKATWTRWEGNISVENTDVEQYVAWINGELVFINEPFGLITNKIERHYNVKIECNYKELKKYRFTGSFKGESIEQVMNTIQKYSPFSYYIEDDKIIINR